MFLQAFNPAYLLSPLSLIPIPLLLSHLNLCLQTQISLSHPNHDISLLPSKLLLVLFLAPLAHI